MTSFFYPQPFLKLQQHDDYKQHSMILSIFFQNKCFLIKVLLANIQKQAFQAEMHPRPAPIILCLFGAQWHQLEHKCRLQFDVH